MLQTSNKPSAVVYNMVAINHLYLIKFKFLKEN